MASRVLPAAGASHTQLSGWWDLLLAASASVSVLLLSDHVSYLLPGWQRSAALVLTRVEPATLPSLRCAVSTYCAAPSMLPRTRQGLAAITLTTQTELIYSFQFVKFIEFLVLQMEYQKNFARDHPMFWWSDTKDEKHKAVTLGLKIKKCDTTFMHIIYLSLITYRETFCRSQGQKNA